MLDRMKTIEAFLEYLEELKEDPGEAREFSVHLRCGRKIVLRADVADVSDRLDLILSMPRLSLVPPLPSPSSSLSRGSGRP